MTDEVSTKETQVEQFIKDLLGGNIYECERKLKEVETAIEKINKRIIELNNGMNDFDIEIKKGMTTGDEEIKKEAKKIIESNHNDRKTLKENDD